MDKHPDHDIEFPDRNASPFFELAKEWGIDSDRPMEFVSESEKRLLHDAMGGADEDELDMLLDDIAVGILKSHSPQFEENLKAVRDRRASESDRAAARDRQTSLILRTREAVLLEAGINPELSVSEDERERQAVRNRLYGARERDGDDFNPLREIGMIQTDSEGNDRFRFPKEVMPKITVGKWNTYVDAVKAHLKSENAVKSGRVDRSELVQADQHRKIAHDSITRDLMNLLGVTDFEEMRRTVAKMRDGNFPSIPTGEEERVNRQLQEGVRMFDALRSHLFPEGAYLPDREDGETWHS